jgi:hypothetical protein
MQAGVADFARKWTDPREKRLRKMKRARRRSVRYGSASGVSAVSTAGLAVASAPEWTLVAGGGAATLLAIPAALAWRRLRQYRKDPLPLRGPLRRFVPNGAAATGLMRRLVASEQSLYQLLLVLAGSQSVPPEEVDEISTAAWETADALEGAAREIAAMEQASRAAKHTYPHLESAIAAVLQRLSDGVAQHEALVAMAAQMAAAAAADPFGGLDRYRHDLMAATDRLEGLAGALHELANVRRPYLQGLP